MVEVEEVKQEGKDYKVQKRRRESHPYQLALELASKITEKLKSPLEVCNFRFFLKTEN